MGVTPPLTRSANESSPDEFGAMEQELHWESCLADVSEAGGSQLWICIEEELPLGCIRACVEGQKAKLLQGINEVPAMRQAAI